MIIRIFKASSLILFILFSLNTSSQVRHDGFVIACPFNTVSSDHKVPVGLRYFDYKLKQQARNEDVNNVEIIVSYSGFEAFPEAQEAYQYAVDIWASLLISDVPIYIGADFQDLGAGILAQAGPTSLWSELEVDNFDDTTIYHVALAEKILRRELNEPGEPDIVANFNSTIDWYFGTDGNVPSDQQEFVSVVLHEIGHGLGFSSLDNYSGGVGFVAPGSFNNHIVDNLNNSIYDIPNNSTELGDFLTSSNVFISSGSVNKVIGGAAELYAPLTYNGGSSISHLGEMFNNTDNALMTFSGSPGESIHDPGPIVIGFFEDMGWLGSSLFHEPDIFINNSLDPHLISLEIKSDIPFDTGFEIPIIHYSFDGFETEMESSMIDEGDGIFSFQINSPDDSGNLRYYFDGLKDELRTYIAPADALTRAGATNTYSVLFRNGEIIDSGLTTADGGDFETASIFVPYILSGSSNLWQLGTPTNVIDRPSSGSKAWKTDLDENIEKPTVPILAGLVSPTFDLSDENSHYTLSFDLFMDVDNESMIASVLYTLDNGSTWDVLGSIGDQRGINWFNVQGGEIGNGWSLNTISLVNEKIAVNYNLDQLNGQDSVIFSIVYYLSNEFDDHAYGYDGIMIDDFEIIKENPKATFVTSIGEKAIFPGEIIEFEYTSNGAIDFLWNFGDGSTSTEENPTHSYAESGNYDVSLTINYSGGSDTQIKIIEVDPFKDPNYRLEDGGTFELSQDDFFVENVSGTGWELGKSSIVGKASTTSGENAWVTGLDDENYLDQSVSYLYTPRFDFSVDGFYEISFKTNYDTEEGWDGFIMEYSNDNGLSWQQLSPFVEEGWYDQIGVDNPEQGWPAIPLFTGSTNNEFVLKSRDVSDLAGNLAVGFRFYWKSDFAETRPGIAIDDFILKGPVGPASVDFTVSNQSVCSGNEVVFESTSSGSIESLDWNFGENASPQSARGAGPHPVVFTSDQIVNNTVTLTAQSSVSGTVVEEKTDLISIVPNDKPTVEAIFVDGHSSITLRSSEADHYQWFLNDEVIDGATERDLLATQNGFYQVEVDVSGCIKFSNDFEVDFILSVEGIESKISIYPNPSNGDFNINFKDIGSLGRHYDIKIYTLAGKEVYSKSLMLKKTIVQVINLSSLKTGTYVLKIESDQPTFITRLIIHK